MNKEYTKIRRFYAITGFIFLFIGLPTLLTLIKLDIIKIIIN